MTDSTSECHQILITVTCKINQFAGSNYLHCQLSCIGYKGIQEQEHHLITKYK